MTSMGFENLSLFLSSIFTSFQLISSSLFLLSDTGCVLIFQMEVCLLVNCCDLYASPILCLLFFPVLDTECSSRLSAHTFGRYTKYAFSQSSLTTIVFAI